MNTLDSFSNCMPITNFGDEDTRFLSNFWMPVIGLEGPSVEHVYAAAKAVSELDREAILACQTPGQAKRLGSKVQKIKCWDDIKLNVMFSALLIKFNFKKNPELARQLLLTKDRDIIEGNTWGDTFWGTCNGKGENHLGKQLMEIRSLLTRCDI